MLASPHPEPSRRVGNQSGTGSRFVQRILTTAVNLRHQKRDALGYLVAVPAAYNRPDSYATLLAE